MADGRARRQASDAGIRLVFDPEMDTAQAEQMAGSWLGGRPQGLDDNSTIGQPLSSLTGSGWAKLAFSTLQDEGVGDVVNWRVVILGRDADGAQLALFPNRLHWDVGRFKNQALYRLVHIYSAGSPSQTPPSPIIIRTPPPAPPIGTGGVYVPPPPQAPPAGVGWTYELYGLFNGQPVPLSSVLQYSRNSYSVRRGGRVLVGESPADGFGFGGSPGQWSTLLPGVSPTAYGQDPGRGIVGFDGRQAWPIPQKTLNQIFGYNWRQTIYP